jgi:exodeoxyribonuclease VII large subunit
MSPLSVLARGYSIALDAGGQAVRDAAALRVGERLLLRLHRGQVVGRVEEIDEDHLLDRAPAAAYVREPGDKGGEPEG